jgi:signal transduction histidine kinase
MEEDGLAAEQRARAVAERNADRMQRLARVATALSSAATAGDVASVIVEETQAAVGADSGGVWMLDPSGLRLDMLASRGMPPGMQATLAHYPLETENPLCLAVRTGKAIWIESWEEFTQRFPSSEARVRQVPDPRPRAFACLPLRFEGRTLGGLAFSFFHTRVIDGDDRAFIGLLAQHCAQGMERARLYERALEAVRVRDDFLAVAGHELRTPLAALLLETDALLAAPDAGIARERSEPLFRTARRLVRLAEQLLDVSRLRAGRLGIEPEDIELSRLVEEVVARTTAGLGPTAVPVSVTAPDRIVGRWDPLRIEQVVGNLVSNACKYGGRKPVEVSVTRTETEARMVVKDRGIGISAADQSRLFERFARGVAPGEYPGLGLGLWIAREIVEAHGGRITVRSEPGQGAEFTVFLPLQAPV